MNADLQAKYDALTKRLRELGRTLVAFSGGVDSALLLLVARRELGRENVLAVTGRGPSFPSADLGAVRSLVDEIGTAHEFLDTGEFDDPRYLANPVNRCYFCRHDLYSKLTLLAAERGLGTVLSGANADDLRDFRPGMRAATELGVVSPLIEAGLGKSELRALAAELGLTIHDKPASPCLSSRVPYGQSITPEKLRVIDEAETYLREQGFRQCRVRHHDQLARIEVPASEIDRFADADLRGRVDNRLRELGFQYVTLDLRGFRSGSLNETLPTMQ